jgi:hypothetical protein
MSECERCDGEGAVLCSKCAGSGEGMADGATCRCCKGGGEVPCGCTAEEREDARSAAEAEAYDHYKDSRKYGRSKL